MVNANKAWRLSDEKKLSEIVNEFLNRGEDIEIAFDAAAVELGRTARGCKDRWNSIYKSRRATQIKPVRTHEYSHLLDNFNNSYTELAKTIGDLVTENKQLKQRLLQLESEANKFQEVRKLIKAM